MPAALPQTIEAEGVGGGIDAALRALPSDGDEMEQAVQSVAVEQLLVAALVSVKTRHGAQPQYSREAC